MSERLEKAWLDHWTLCWSIRHACVVCIQAQLTRLAGEVFGYLSPNVQSWTCVWCCRV